MRLLYITPVFQHPTVRGSTRCYFVGKTLAQRHEVTMLTLRRSDIAAVALKEVQSYLRLFMFNAAPDTTANLVIRKISGALANKNAIREMREKFLGLLRQEHFDAVLFHGKSVFPVINKWQSLPLVIDFCDATSMRIKERMRFESPVRRVALKQRLQKFKEVESQMIAKTPHLAFISSRDRDAVTTQRPGIRIVPNGVDLQFWQRRHQSPRRNCVVFTGVMDYRPNADAAHHLIDDILPLLRKRLPKLEILIVGRDPGAALLEKADRHPEVTVTGFVEDVRDYLEQATVFIAPIRYASGVQNKILEAFAMKVPVLCSSAVAEGLRFEDGEMAPLRIADEPAEVADALVALLGDDPLRKQLADDALDFVKRRFIWKKNVQILEKQLATAIAACNGEPATLSLENAVK